MNSSNCTPGTVAEETVLAWLRRTAHQAAEINRHLLQDLPVTQVPLDEMWHCIERKHDQESAAAGKSLPESAEFANGSDELCPGVSTMLTAIVGPRTRETTKEVVAATETRVAGIPAFFSEGFTCSLATLVAAFHVVTTSARTGKRGRPHTPICAPHPNLLSGQVLKQQK